MNEKYLKPYEPSQVEDELYALWEKSGLFNPDVCIEEGITTYEAEHFSIVLPPPNATGILHIGHASLLTIEDILIRFNRMRGLRTLWIPGTDHAAIATESVVTKILEKEGIKKRDIGREEFLKHVDAFVKDSRGTISTQAKKLGASLDWSREAFTLDDTRRNSVFYAFKSMYDKGLIYQGDRIVNWDPKGQTTISDDEIVREEEKTTFYYFKYGPFTIGTARPETKFADKYIVIHPDDKRYTDFKHGDTLEVPWIDGTITATVLKDSIVDPAFGTGVMTITPWHSQVDFELAEKYNLDKEQIIDTYGKLLPIAGEFAGMKIEEARAAIVKKLSDKGLLVRTEEGYVHQLAKAERTSGIIEPQIMKQWFIDVTKKFPLPSSSLPGFREGDMVSLKDLMLAVVKDSHIQILPERFEKVYFDWIENLRDWCISRQIWYGHRIPVWYRGDEIVVRKDAPEGEGWTQDPDTLDTWFSSSLWTFSTLGWPHSTDDLARYHPTSVLETGYDIIFFWVARMIMMSTYHLGDIPFKTVYFHGLVRDGKGRKISKSLGNNIDPREMSALYGTDALRMALIVGVGPGADNNLSEDKIRAYKKFANKLWNASRFVFENIADYDGTTPSVLTQKDTERLAELSHLMESVTSNLSSYKLHLAADALYHYFWHTFADVIIEESKSALTGASKEEKVSAQYTILTILSTCLKLLHPFMPFVTEEIWKDIPHVKKRLLMVERWPGS